MSTAEDFVTKAMKNIKTIPSILLTYHGLKQLLAWSQNSFGS